MSHDPSRRYWENASAQVAGRVNLTIWLERAAPACFGVACLTALVVYAARRLDRDPLWSLAAGAVLLGAVGTVVAWRARSRFFDRNDARVLLESGLQLDTGLTAAATGLRPWPAQRSCAGLLQWRPGPMLLWLAAGAALVIAGFLLPLPARDFSQSGPVAKPPSLERAEALIEQIQQIAVAEPATLEQLSTQAKELGRRPPEEQYSHSGLEAADTLHEQTLVALQNLAQAFESAEAALASLEKNASGRPEEIQAAAGKLSTALQAMREGRLSAHADLQAALQGLDASRMRSLTAEQLQQLKKQLSEAAQKSRGVAGAAQHASVATMDPNRPVLPSWKQRGAGGPGPGGGHDPLTFSAKPTDASAKKLEGLGGDDDEKLAMGDLVEIVADRHEVDRTKAAGTASGGTIAEPAHGGEAVWTDRLTPSERAALRKFFK